jgi:hypothetical protein
MRRLRHVPCGIHVTAIINDPSDDIGSVSFIFATAANSTDLTSSDDKIFICQPFIYGMEVISRGAKHGVFTLVLFGTVLSDGTGDVDFIITASPSSKQKNATDS